LEQVTNQEYNIDIVNGTTMFNEIGGYQTLVLPLKKTTAVEFTESNSSINVYPNPTSSFIHLSTLNKSISKIIITNANGKTCRVLSKFNDEHDIDVSDFNPGIYTMQIFFKSNIPRIARFVVMK